MKNATGMTLTFMMKKCVSSNKWIGRVLEVPGAMSQASSKEELRTNLADAARTVFAYHKEHSRHGFIKQSVAEQEVLSLQMA